MLTYLKIARSLIVLFLLISLTAHPASTESVPQIRVLIARSADPFTISIDGQYLVRDPKTDKKLAVSKDLIGVRLYTQNDQLKLAGVSFPDQIELHSLSSKNIKINDRFYRGILSAFRNPDNSISIINTLSVDHYLYGVLMKEVGEWWPAEALKAQAIAARTYAMYQVNTQVNQSFDVYTNQFSQMYGGVNSENPRGNTAVNDTRGEVLTFNKQIFPTFYHATCGGMTRPASDLWDIDIPPLQGGSHCQYCWFSPHFSWDVNLTMTEVRSSLSNFLSDLDDISAVFVGETTAENRVKDLVFVSSNRQAVVPAKNFRSNLGSERVRSDAFEVTFKHGDLRLKGHGWGHGVGMCQWGALGQAIIRKKYNEILAFYYPESQLTHLF